jgi:hypothetical protein
MSAALQFGKGIGTCVVSVLVAQCLMAQTDPSTGRANREVRPLAKTSVELPAFVPMTQKERAHYYFWHMFSAESVLRAGAGAAINQAMNTPSEWCQGAEGYARRLASTYGGHIVQSTVMYGTGALLHEDNRYFRSGQPGVCARLKYAIASTFLARHDDGSRHLSLSRLSSYAAASAISRVWQPPSTDKPANAVDAFGIAVRVEAAFNVAREFLPGIFHSGSPVAQSQNPTH